MKQLLARLRPSTRRALTGVAGAAAIAPGLLLLPRPLTALLVLSATVCLSLAVAAVLRVTRQPQSVWRWTTAGALLAVAIVASLQLPALIVALPYLLAAALAAATARRLFTAAKQRTAAGRVVPALYAVAFALFALLAWLWPDLASVAIGAGFAATLVFAGVRLLIRALRARPAAATTPQAPQPRRATSVARQLLRWSGAVATLLLAGVLTWGSFGLRAATPHADDFYSWTAPIPTTPGKVLRVAPYHGDLPAGAQARKVLYATTYSDGSPALASAVLAFPTAPATAPRPVLAWQHGTTGVAQACGPSLGTQALTNYAIPGVDRALAEGWVVVATDYPGQGTPGRYPYLIGEGEGRATLDGVRAAQQVADAHASADTWIWGHSQGGHATLWAAQIAAEYAPELNVLGVAALSAAADPLTLATRVTGAGSSPLGAVVTSLVLVPYAQEYSDVTLGAAVHPAGQGIVTAFASRCVTDPTTLVSVLVGTALSADAPLYQIDVDSGPTHDRLQQNAATGLVPAPLFLGQGVDDEVIPINMQRTLRAALCAADRTVEAHEYAGKSHMGVIAEGSPLIDDLFAWADAVHAGAQPTNCSG